ncbi:MAG: TetR family transcriptional regulator [Streptosporangiales bacterium]|nr:TetR family transcriptional regulator [Streptosporangiales bacterium]
MTATSVERGRATRQRLLDAAVPLIGEVGWNGVTTRLVAERAEVNPGLVHYHFASVSDLLAAASIGFARELLGRTATQLADQPDVPRGIDWLLAELSGYTGTDPASLLLIESFLASTRLPELRAQLGDLVADFRACVADWLRGHGYDADAEAAAALLAAAVDGLILHRTLDPALDLTAFAGLLRRMVQP